MTTMLSKLASVLHVGDFSLVVANPIISTYNGRGVSDLYRMVSEHDTILLNAFVADKIVGKGAAALMVLGGVKAIYADVISSAALQLLRNASIEVECSVEVPHIINRKGTDICPIEKLCSACSTAEECLPLITDFLTEMKRRSAQVDNA
jgi:iron complex outermembrane receptor protein